MATPDIALLASFVLVEVAWFPVLLWCARGARRDRARAVGMMVVAFVMFVATCIPMAAAGVPAQPIVVANQCAAFAACGLCLLTIWRGPRGPRGV